MNQSIILASSSPRRQEMLRNLGLAFATHPSKVDETADPSLKPSELVELLAERKAADVAASYSSGIVIGSDTIVVLDGQALGKPTDERDAFQMLTRLQGTTHSVFSGLALINAANGKKKIGSVETKVKMRAVSEREIQDYILTGEPMDKAGSYAIQGLGSIFVDGIEGDYFSVVGLPIRLFSEYAASFGIDILKQQQLRHTPRNQE